MRLYYLGDLECWFCRDSTLVICSECKHGNDTDKQSFYNFNMIIRRDHDSIRYII